MTMTERHYHVHSHIGNGYLCECDSHHPIATIKDRDAAMREEKWWWLDYIAQGPADSHMAILGSVKDGYTVTDRDAIAWERYVSWFECFEPECFEDDAS